MTDVFDIFRPEQAQQDPYSLPLDQLDVANPFLFAQGAEGPWFKRLRDEAPVHYCHNSFFGPYWSVTRYQDIMQVDTSHDIYSSEPAITIRDPIEDFPLPMFIAKPLNGFLSGFLLDDYCPVGVMNDIVSGARLSVPGKPEWYSL